MKKIGILTFHNVPNYGAILQTYALKKYLEKISNREVRIIDFQCQGNDRNFEPNMIEKQIITRKGFVVKRVIKLFRYLVFSKKAYTKKTKMFSEFRRIYLNIDSELNVLKKNYDLVVCGSDQIWNPNITKGFQDYYFGANKNQTGLRTISYAASCGDVEEISAENENQFLNNISKLGKVGIREKSLDNYLHDRGIESFCNIDPTFLLCKEEYIEEFSLSCLNEKYILVYALQKNGLLESIAKKVASELQLPIIVVCGYMAREKHGDNELFDVAPTKFLELLYNSDYVITNSFHGLAFSLIFEKNFSVVMPKSRGSRLQDFLLELNLLDRVCVDDNIRVTDVNYKSVNNLLKSKIESSKQYLISEIGR